MAESNRRPRVLYLINGFKRGGAERGLLHLVQNGAFDGCDLKVQSIIEDHGAHVGDLTSAGVIVEHLWSGRRMSPWQWLAAIHRFRQELKRFAPDLLVLSLPQANIAGRLAAVGFSKLTVASFEHNTHLAKPVYERLFRLTSRRVDWLLADCEVTAHMAQKRLYNHRPKEQIVLPLASFPKQAARQIMKGASFRIISAARFTDTKNQKVIIEAVRLLKDRGYLIDARLYGEGPKANEYQALINDLDLTDDITMPGFDPNWMTYPADLFVVASKNEGLCIVALEALSRGIPVVATKVGGLLDYGIDARVSFLEEGSASELAAAVACLIDAPDKLANMRAAGITMVEQRFSEASVNRTYRHFSAKIKALVLQRSLVRT